MCIHIRDVFNVKITYMYQVHAHLYSIHGSRGGGGGSGVTHTRNLQNYEKGKSFHLRALCNEISMKS